MIGCMPELDYAMLAEYAKVDSDRLTLIGASYTHVTAPDLPAPHMLYIAGRVRARVEDPEFVLKLTFSDPRSDLEVAVEGALNPGNASARPYGEDKKVGVMFAAGMTVVLPTEGLYEVFIDIDGERVRRLAFDLAVESA